MHVYIRVCDYMYIFISYIYRPDSRCQEDVKGSILPVTFKHLRDLGNHTQEELSLIHFLENFQVMDGFRERMVNISFHNNLTSSNSRSNSNEDGMGMVLGMERRMLRVGGYFRSWFHKNEQQPVEASVLGTVIDNTVGNQVQGGGDKNYTTEEAALKLVSEYNKDEYDKKV